MRLDHLLSKDCETPLLGIQETEVGRRKSKGRSLLHQGKCQRQHDRSQEAEAVKAIDLRDYLLLTELVPSLKLLVRVSPKG